MKKLQEKENIGRTIRLLRTAAGIKQKELAETVGIQPNSLSLIESGRRGLSLTLLRLIAKALDVPVSLLFWDSGGYSRKTSRETALLKQLKEQLLDMEVLRLSERASKYSKKR